jgi:hypothetical protein
MSTGYIYFSVDKKCEVQPVSYSKLWILSSYTKEVGIWLGSTGLLIEV